MSETLVNVTPPSGDAYEATLDSIRSGGWSILCGSAISIFEPTSLPSGMDVASKLASAFCGEACVGEPFRRLILEVPYEVILSLYPRKDELDHILASYFRNGGTDHEATGRLSPNAIHEVIASLLLDGTFRNVLTTNYDPCIEAGSGGRIEASIDGDGLTGDRKGLLYKIHGCAVRGSMVYTIEQEPRMPADKLEVLRRCAGDKLLVVGYSGLDFEVCPELYSMKLGQLAWIAFPADKHSLGLSPNARKVLGNHPNHLVICADMRTVFRDLLGLSKDWSPDRGRPRMPDLPDLLRDRLSPSEHRLWAARVFLNMSAPSAAFRILEKEETESGSLSRQFLEIRGQAMNHAGLYRDAADLFAAAAEDTRLDGSSRFFAKLSESGSAGMGAFDERAATALVEAESLLHLIKDAEARADAELNVQWLKLIKERGSLDRRDVASVDRLLREFRTLRLLAEKRNKRWLVGLCENEIKEVAGEQGSGHEAGRMPEDAHDIFSRHGSFVGQVTAERDRARRTWDKRDGDIIEGRLDGLRALGLIPELWRVLYTLIHFKGDRDARLSLQQEFEAELGRCQFDDGYVREMRQKAREAVENPMGIQNGEPI